MQIVSQISLNQDDIEKAITLYIKAAGVDVGDTKPEIVLVGKKNDVSASINISTGVKAQLGDMDIDLLNKPTKTLGLGVAAEKAAPKQVVAAKPPVETTAPVEEAAPVETTAPVEEAAPVVEKAAPVVSGSLFGTKAAAPVEEAVAAPTTGLFAAAAGAPVEEAPAVDTGPVAVTGDTLFGATKA